MRTVRLAIGGVISLSILAGACHSLDIVPPDLGPPPIADVVVYTWPGLVQIGDTLRITSEGFNSAGYGYVRAAPFTWSSPDAPRLISIQSVASQNAYTYDALIHGNALGKATVNVTANSKTGTGTVEVIPRLSRLVISPDNVTIAVGDTAKLSVAVITATGDTLKGYLPVIRTVPDFSASLSFVGPTSFRGTAPGTTDVTATLAGVIGKARVIVVAKP